MTSFRGWYVPPGFTVRQEEISHLDDEAVPPSCYAALSESRLQELLGFLRRGGERWLASFPVNRVIDGVDRVARRLLSTGDGLRIAALESLAPFSGFSAPMAEAVLEGMARSWTRGPLSALVQSEFPDPAVLDGFRPGPNGGQTRALGFPLAFHLGAGTVPGVGTTSLIRSLLVKSAVLLRPGMGDLPLPVVFAQGLEEEDPELAGSIAVLYWPTEESGRTETVLGEVDLVVTYGSDRTVRFIRERLPPQTPLRAYRHRMGLGLVGRGALGVSAGEVAMEGARAVAMFDQKGCVSPHLFFVERGGDVEPDEWAALLAGALGELETVLPSGELTLEDGVAIQQLRGVAELGEGSGDVVVHHGGERAPWTVLFLPGGTVEPSCLRRVVRVLPVDSVKDGLLALRTWAPYLQTVGVAGFEGRAEEVLEELVHLGVSRISSLKGVPWPKAWWHHDGTGPLRDLVRWTDVEGEGLFSSGEAEE